MATDLIANPQQMRDLKAASQQWPSWDLTAAQVAELGLLMLGYLTPLTGYLGSKDCESVSETRRLQDGTYCPWPLTLTVTADFASNLTRGQWVALRDPEGVMLAALALTEIYEMAGKVQLAGNVTGICPPIHYDAPDLRKTPETLQAELTEAAIIAYPVEGPLHPGDIEALEPLANDGQSRLLILLIDRSRGRDDVAHYSRVRCLRAAMDAFSVPVTLQLLPWPNATTEPATWLAWAWMARNCGATHMACDSEHGYQTISDESANVGLQPIRVAHGGAREEVERLTRQGQALPDGLTFPAVAKELRFLHPPRHQQGLTVFFTGFSGSGKSTVANVLMAKLLERGGRHITLLDGDLVRKNLSSELSFSKAHRNLNIQRIGFVASLVTKSGGIAICAPIAPYDHVRQQVRELVEAHGGFVLVHISTPIEACEARDRKGLYAKARAGIIKEFTGISDPYEVPEDAELSIDTTTVSAEAAAQHVIDYLESEGWV